MLLEVLELLIAKLIPPIHAKLKLLLLLLLLLLLTGQRNVLIKPMLIVRIPLNNSLDIVCKMVLQSARI